MQAFGREICEKNLLVEKLVLEQKQINDCNRDICVGQIEDRAEEVIVAVDQESQHTRHAVPLEQREIEHVDDLSHHESGVVAAEFGDGIGRRLREQQPVAGAIDDVAQGAGQNQRQTHEYSAGRVGAAAGQVP